MDSAKIFNTDTLNTLKKNGFGFSGDKAVAVDNFVSIGLQYILHIILAVIILTVGWWLINKFLEFLDNKFEKLTKLDKTVKSFLSNFIHIALRGLLILLVLNVVGIQTTSIVAILGAASFAVGLALQGSLANFAGGVLILIFKPFKIGDVIEAFGKIGRVKQIQLFNSMMVTSDNKIVIIPNSKLTGEILTNYTKLGNIQSNISFNIKPNVDIKIVRQEIKKLLKSMPEILDNPEPVVLLNDFDTDKVHLVLRFNITVGNSTAITFKVREQIYFLVKKLENEGIISDENNKDLSADEKDVK